LVVILDIFILATTRIPQGMHLQVARQYTTLCCLGGRLEDNRFSQSTNIDHFMQLGIVYGVH